MLFIGSLLVWQNNFEYNSNLGKAYIISLNVGQGDAALIKTPNNFWGLIDTGQNTSVFDEIEKFLPLFHNKLDFLVLSHADRDHIGMSNEIINKYNISHVFFNKTYKESKIYADLISSVKTNEVTQYEIYENNDYFIDGMKFDVVWPIKKLDYEIEENDRSIAMIISYDDTDYLTLGDLNADTEIKAIESLNPNDTIEILKVSHHGSKNSTSKKFVELVNPQNAVISVGKNNFGHPSDSVLKILKDNGVNILRTDKNGSIQFNF